MPNPTYLMKRNGVYYARIPVPTFLQSEIGRKELWKSLGNRSYKESCKLLKQALLSETLLMAYAKQETELLKNPIAMRAIGQRQFELERQRLARQYLSYMQQYSGDNVQEELRDTNLHFRMWQAEERIAEVKADLEKANFEFYEPMLSMRLQTTRFHRPERNTSLYKEAMTQLLMGHILDLENSHLASSYALADKLNDKELLEKFTQKEQQLAELSKLSKDIFSDGHRTAFQHRKQLWAEAGNTLPFDTLV